MRHTLSAAATPILTVALDAGEALFSLTATMLWMEAGIDMSTNARKGLFGGFRPPDGYEPFTVEYRARAAASLAFAPRLAGTIVPFDVGAGEVVICRQEALLCAARPMEAKPIWERQLGGVAYSYDFVMLRVTGPGTLFLSVSGLPVERELVRGESLRVPADHVAMLDPTIVIEIELVLGFENRLLEVNGLHLATLTGPGRVTLQSMPLMTLAEDVGRLLPDKPR